MTETQGEAEIIDHVPTMRDVLGAIEKDELEKHKWIDRAARRPWWIGVPLFAVRMWYGLTLLYASFIVGFPLFIQRFRPDSALRVDYYELVIFVSLLLLATGIGGFVGARRALGSGHFRREVRRWAIEHATWAVWGSAIIAGFVYATTFGGGSIGLPVLMLSSVAVMQTFFLLAVNRKGIRISCACCGYPYSTDTSGTCPECGTKWLRPNGLTQGIEFRRKWQVIAIGVCAMAGLYAGGFLHNAAGSRVAARWFMPSIPDDTLISRIVRAPSSLGSAEFIELSGRQLTEDQVVRLATAMLDPERRPGRWTVSEANWLLDQIESGSLPDPLVERFERAATRGEVQRLLPRVSLGFTLSPSVAITPRWDQLGRFETLIAFAGFTRGVGQAPSVSDPGVSPLGRESEFVSASTNPRFNTVFRASEGGNLVVRAEWFVVLMPPGMPMPTLVWRDDNTIEPPPDAAHVFRGYAEGVIQIVP